MIEMNIRKRMIGLFQECETSWKDLLTILENCRESKFYFFIDRHDRCYVVCIDLNFCVLNGIGPAWTMSAELGEELKRIQDETESLEIKDRISKIIYEQM